MLVYLYARKVSLQKCDIWKKKDNIFYTLWDHIQKWSSTHGTFNLIIIYVTIYERHNNCIFKKNQSNDKIPVWIFFLFYLHSALETDAKNRSCIHLHCLLNWRWQYFFSERRTGKPKEENIRGSILFRWGFVCVISRVSERELFSKTVNLKWQHGRAAGWLHLPSELLLDKWAMCSVSYQLCKQCGCESGQGEGKELTAHLCLVQYLFHLAVVIPSISG